MEIKNVFAIIDPTSSNDRLLDVLQRLSKRGATSITAFCCIHNSYKANDQEMSVQVEKQRFELWLDMLLTPLREAGVNITKQITWHPDWREGISNAVKNTDCDLIVKNSYSHTNNRLAKSIDKAVLRYAKVPVVLLRRKQAERTGVILAAIKTHDLDALHEKANQNIIDFCLALTANNPDLSLHAVTVYSGSDQFIYPEDFAKKVGLERQQVLTIDAHPTEGLKQAVNKVNAELLMIGSVEHPGVVGRLMGNTAEQLLEGLDTDIIAFIQRG